MVLNEAVKIDFLLVLLAKCLDLAFVIDCHILPFRELGCAVYVPEHAECRIWEQPVSVRRQELPVSLALAYL